jgi:hypothetical protein
MVGDRVRHSSTSRGTGAFALGSALPTFASFQTAGLTGVPVYYTIVNRGRSAEWETGVGTVASGQLSRTTVLASSAGGATVDFGPGTKDVFGSVPASKVVYLDDLGRLATLAGPWFFASGTDLVPAGRAVGLTSAVYLANNATFNALDLGAARDFTGDASVAINSAIQTAYNNAGGIVTIPAGRYRLLNPIVLRSGVTLRGTIGGWEAGGARADGTRLVWGGANGGRLLECIGTEYTDTFGLCLEANGATGMTGVLVDSTNSPAAVRNTLAGVQCHDMDVGVQLGTSGGTGYASDGFTLRDFKIYNPQTAGVRINSQNACQNSVIEGGFIQIPALNSAASGVEFQHAPNQIFLTRVSIGAGSGYTGAALYHNLPSSSGGQPLNVVNCDFEVGATGYVFKTGSGDDLSGTVNLIGNSFGTGNILVSAARRIVSIGNSMYNTNAQVTHAQARVRSIDDTYTPTYGWKASNGARIRSGATAVYVVDGWRFANPAANTANVAVARGGTNTYFVPSPGSLLGLYCRTSAAVSHDLTITLTKNGSGFATLTVTAGTSFGVVEVEPDSTPVAAGDVLGVLYTTPVGWASTTITGDVSLKVEH